MSADTPTAATPTPALPMRTPRPWYGMTLPVWLRLLTRNRFAVSPTRLPMALAVTAVSALNSGAALAQRVRFGRAVANAAVHPEPLFIVGYWRTGTTLAHELLALDGQFAFPTTYQCMAPGHFMVGQRFVTRRLGFLLPEHRPMDSMRLRWDLPQEDEFALCLLGLPSLYREWAFPRRPLDPACGLDPDDWPDEERRCWEAGYLGFLRSVSLGDGRPLVLKSPPHAARLTALHRLFPRARFVHTVRDPYSLAASLMPAWRRMAEALGLQRGYPPHLEQALLDRFQQIYQRFEADRGRIGPDRIVDVRYEDLAADPAAALSGIYRHLGLPHIERVDSTVARYQAEVGGYRPNVREPAPALRHLVTRYCAAYADRYGYPLDPPSRR
jgi:hypothetical protein